MKAGDVIKLSVKCLDLDSDDFSLDNYLDNYLKDSKARGKVTSVLFYYYRNKLSIDYIIKYFAAGKIKKKVFNVLSMAVTQIFFQTSIRGEVVIDSAVSHTKKIFGKRTAGFVNAVLRKVYQRKDFIDDILKDAPEYVKINIPEYVGNRWRKFYTDEEFEKITKIIKLPRYSIFYRYIKPPKRSEQAGQTKPIENSERIRIREFNSNFIFYKSDTPLKVIESKELNTGKIYIQNPATSLAVSAVNFGGNGKILDACSAPGGKTLMLAELYPNSVVYAADRSQRRLDKVSKNIKLSGLKNIITVLEDITETEFPDNSFDVVFLDVPCSNSGVIRKRPDALWNLTQANIESIKQLQSDILNSAKRLVKPGGKFVYSTCSIEKDENIETINEFLSCNDNYKLEFQKQLLPDENNDGAFAAVMKKD
ncbi:MAG: methyltransferase domain-containing protein [Victivallales bacterium]|nr:methyltransferase domain-containing protein [Victivallales bacterium]MCF7888514.1 methyltransferase domain-containing protein [Victivallales bacterium]